MACQTVSQDDADVSGNGGVEHLLAWLSHGGEDGADLHDNHFLEDGMSALPMSIMDLSRMPLSLASR